MNRTRCFEKYVIVAIALIAFLPGATRVVIGGGAASTSARTTFQRTVDTPSPGAQGTVDLKNSGGKQTFKVDVENIGGDSFGLFLGFQNGFDTNKVFLIGALNGLLSGHWVVDYSANNGLAPVQLLGCYDDGESERCVGELGDLSGMFLFISQPTGTTNITDCVTNLVNCTTNLDDCITNIVEGVTNVTDCVTNLVNCTTNIDDCVTNVTVGAVLVTEVPPLTSNNGIFNFKGKSALVLPEVPPNGKAKGSVSVKFTATQGRSFLDIRAMSLFGNQVYSLYMSTNAGGAAETKIAEMTESSPTSVFYRRDTKLGETLPFFVSTVTNLSGFNIEIRDAFNDVHLEGTIP
jgi:hypothetical protein